MQITRLTKDLYPEYIKNIKNGNLTIKKQSNLKMGKRLEHSVREATQMTSKHMNKHATSLATGDVKVKTTMRPHSTLTRMAK